MKTLPLLLILSIILQTELIGQQRFSVKLNKTQIQNLKIEKNWSFVDITFGDELIIDAIVVICFQQTIFDIEVE
jgi:hypothetical protein